MDTNSTTTSNTSATSNSSSSTSTSTGRTTKSTSTSGAMMLGKGIGDILTSFGAAILGALFITVL
ncbi:hypothetical protein BDZ45DRAFT_679677 [Acephala macrosclerotiorum]|nr:hypothetical protein BDZ45DRAFT_679677 [Acephala macrosclerotiorum]